MGIRDLLNGVLDHDHLESSRRWEEEHRWDELAHYNARVSQGIVHTPEYAARMAEEQEAWREWVESTLESRGLA